MKVGAHATAEALPMIPIPLSFSEYFRKSFVIPVYHPAQISVAKSALAMTKHCAWAELRH